MLYGIRLLYGSVDFERLGKILDLKTLFTVFVFCVGFDIVSIDLLLKMYVL